MHEEAVKQLANQNKQMLRSKKENAKLSEEEINEKVMDIAFDMFVGAKLHRSDLVIIAHMFGFEVSQEFLNDPHKDPIDCKGEK
jgi:hypothetical protein